MHQIGSRMFTTQWRNGEYLGDLNHADYYDFDFQQTTPMNKTIKRGDRLNTHCIYNSLRRQNPTKFASGSRDEMCIDFITYYPRMPDVKFCGHARSDFQFDYLRNYTLCGTTYEYVIDEFNPSVVDPPSASRLLFGSPTCSTSTTTSSAEASPGSSSTLSPSIVVAIVVPVAVASIAAGTVLYFVKRKKVLSYSHVEEPLTIGEL